MENLKGCIFDRLVSEQSAVLDLFSSSWFDILNIRVL